MLKKSNTKAKKKRAKRRGPTPIADLLRKHFAPLASADLTVSERKFPFRVRADLQRAIEGLFGADGPVLGFFGVRKEYAHEGIDFAAIISDRSNPALPVPPQYEEVDVGDEAPVRCLKNGLWLLASGGDGRYAVLLAPASRYGQTTGVTFQVACPAGEAGVALTQAFFRHLEEAVSRAQSYRGKILSLEEEEHAYGGHAAGIKVHTLRTVAREQVILPPATLDLLDRNIIGFVRNRPKLARFRQATKKGILFYGPPGTGKTHTIHYLARSLPGHTTLLVSAEQVALLGEYMTLARLLQPSVVVIEDVDLIARDRATMGSPCEEVLLNKLLNEMDGLREDADILFLLTTNRPEALEAALASRPGRVDQAIEFPLPDDEGREKLVGLYSQGVDVPPAVVAAVVGRTEGVSAAFIKELMRRSVQFHLERSESGRIELRDVEAALQEMLFSGGSLNRKLLGGNWNGQPPDAIACGAG
jgi:cell division protease FtsH